MMVVPVILVVVPVILAMVPMIDRDRGFVFFTVGGSSDSGGTSDWW
jgi:hypothetical protein